MTSFIENLIQFLTDNRNNVLEEACENQGYIDLKSRSTELSERLLALVLSKHQELLIDFLDSLGEIGNKEGSYCYLCGLYDSNKPEIRFNPTSEDAMAGLAVYKQYVDLKVKTSEKHEEIRTILNDECCCLLDEYIIVENAMRGIEKTYCFIGGMRDKKRLENQFDPSAENARYDLMCKFL